MENGGAIIIRGNAAEILPSLEEYHVKYKDNRLTWNELTNDKEKRKLFAANAAPLTKIKWSEVETVVGAAQKLEAAETRKSLMAVFDGRKVLNDLLNAIAYFPVIIFILWGFNFAAKRCFGAESSHLRNGAIAAFGTAVVLNFFPKRSPGRGAVIAALCGYLFIALVLWKFG